ncbi:MAG: hypothetical protein V7637_2328 [Mycobacteriales bacterium]|jgi:methylamine dehydrogenase accessory protein MauD
MSTPFLVSYVLLWVLVAGLFVGMLALYHHFGEMYLSSPQGRSAQGPDEGSTLKALEAHTVDATAVVLPVDRPTLLLFVSTTCDVCKEVRTAVPRLVADHTDVSVVVVCAGRPAMVRAWAEPIAGLVPVIADPRSRISEQYQVDLRPFCIAVGADGLVRARGIANTHDGLEMAVEDAKSLPIVDAGTPADGHDHLATRKKEPAK